MPEIQLSEEIHRNFHLFWDNYPFPVMLVHKDRTILDRSPLAEAAGCVIGTRCIDRGNREAHKGCLADQALRQQTGKRAVVNLPEIGLVIDSYWIPLAGHPEVFVHFGADITAQVAGLALAV